MAARSFRVELLHAEALPLYLLNSSTGLLEITDDQLVRNAAEAHRRHLAEHLKFIRGIDYARKERELQVRYESLGWRNFRGWSETDLDEAISVAWQFEHYSEAYDLLNDSFFNLVALGFFASGAAREDVLASLQAHSWATTHEILTRWGWIGEHRRLLEQGTKLNKSVLLHRRSSPRCGQNHR